MSEKMETQEATVSQHTSYPFVGTEGRPSSQSAEQKQSRNNTCYEIESESRKIRMDWAAPE